MVRQSATSSKLDTVGPKHKSKLDLRFRELSARSGTPTSRARGGSGTGSGRIGFGNAFRALLEDSDDDDGDDEEGEGKRKAVISETESTLAGTRRIGNGVPEGVNGEEEGGNDAWAEGFVAVPKRERRPRKTGDGSESKATSFAMPRGLERENWSSEEEDEWMEDVFSGAFTRSLGYRSRKALR